MHIHDPLMKANDQRARRGENPGQPVSQRGSEQVAGEGALGALAALVDGLVLFKEPRSKGAGRSKPQGSGRPAGEQTKYVYG